MKFLLGWPIFRGYVSFISLLLLRNESVSDQSLCGLANASHLKCANGKCGSLRFVPGINLHECEFLYSALLLSFGTWC